MLYSRSYEITKELEPYIEGLFSIMLRTMLVESGIGIAAPQLGIPLQAFIIGIEKKRRV